MPDTPAHHVDSVTPTIGCGRCAALFQEIRELTAENARLTAEVERLRGEKEPPFEIYGEKIDPETAAWVNGL